MPKLSPQQALDILARYADGPFPEINTALVTLQQLVDSIKPNTEAKPTE